ncbi:hypothetical protein KM043_002367 [Ampulex compressa]|nr:hypothetical protein KM043_002367 [Ampulex compressa]
MDVTRRELANVARGVSRHSLHSCRLPPSRRFASPVFAAMHQNCNCTGAEGEEATSIIRNFPPVGSQGRLESMARALFHGMRNVFSLLTKILFHQDWRKRL